MNILYTNFHFSEGGGHTTYILSLLNNPKHNAFVACPPSSRLYRILEERKYPGLIPIEFYAKIKDWRKVRENTAALRRAIEQHSIDIVHTNGSPDNRMALYAAWFSKKKFKIVFTKHNSRPVKGFISRLRFNYLNKAVIFVSEPSCRESGFDLDNPRFHAIENGVDLEHWKRQQPITTGDKLRLVSTAGTVRTKGWIQLAEAVAGLPEESRARLSVEVLGRYEPVFEKMQNRARELCGMEFPGYFLDPRPKLEEGDIAFNLSYQESCSFALREMMAMSLPAIVSDCPIFLESVDESSGWITKRKDPESIRAVLEKILAMSPEELNTMKQAARRHAEEKFALGKMIEETNKVYDDLWP